MYDDTQLIIYLISRIRNKANRFIVSSLEAHGIKGIIPVHGDILYILFTYKELSMKEIARLINRKKSTVTTLVGKLAELGYVDRKKDINDSRSTLISLTDKGLGLGSAVKQISEELIDKVYQDMKIEDRLTLVNLLRRVNDNLQ